MILIEKVYKYKTFLIDNNRLETIIDDYIDLKRTEIMIF